MYADTGALGDTLTFDGKLSQGISLQCVRLSAANPRTHRTPRIRTSQALGSKYICFEPCLGHRCRNAKHSQHCSERFGTQWNRNRSPPRLRIRLREFTLTTRTLLTSSSGKLRRSKHSQEGGGQPPGPVKQHRTI